MHIKAGCMRRSYRPFKLKAKPDDSGVFEGYASVFDVVDSYKETIRKGAFVESLKEHKRNGTMPKMLWQHDWDKPIGVWELMEEDDHGLFVRGKLLKDEVQQAREAYALLREGALDGMSIGYIPLAWEKNAEDEDVIDLTKIDLWENSVVTFPANPEARVTEVRTLPKTIREFESLLRDAGFSAQAAKAVAASGFKARTDARDEPDQGVAAVLAVLRSNISILNSKE